MEYIIFVIFGTAALILGITILNALSCISLNLARLATIQNKELEFKCELELKRVSELKEELKRQEIHAFNNRPIRTRG